MQAKIKRIIDKAGKEFIPIKWEPLKDGRAGLILLSPRKEKKRMERNLYVYALALEKINDLVYNRKTPRWRKLQKGE
ncbi:MAG TPA: hypothetical protein VJB08_03960 [Candidatus Nanoarchaeia archaeon]|nr:hypothetical protein [Candidatus Nanoarchaeia archaeon]